MLQMRRGRRLPGERLARAPRTRPCGLERRGVAEQLANRRGQPFDIAGLDHAAGAELAHRLGEAADVVDDRGHARAERAQERGGHVDLRLVREERERRDRERVVDLRLGLVLGAPLDVGSGRGRAVRLERLERLAGDEQPRPFHPLRRLDRVAEALVGRISPRQRSVCPSSRRGGSLGKSGIGITRSFSSGTPNSASVSKPRWRARRSGRTARRAAATSSSCEPTAAAGGRVR